MGGMHFTVMVFGDHIDDQLETFSEHIEVEPYFTQIGNYTVKIIEEKIAEGKFDDLLGGATNTDEDIAAEDLEESDFTTLSHTEQVCLVHTEHYGEELIYDDDADAYFVEATWNPNGQWDWYVVGGRWSGYFKVKDGADPLDVDYAASEGSAFADANSDPAYADRLRKRAIDLEGMRQKAYDDALASHRKLRQTWERAIAEHGEPDISFLKARPGVDMDRDKYMEMRSALYNHPAFKQLRDELGPFLTLKNLEVDDETYAERMSNNVLIPYAFINHEGDWVSREVYTLDEGFKTDENYEKMFWDEFHSTPDDEFVTIVDCHS